MPDYNFIGASLVGRWTAWKEGALASAAAYAVQAFLLTFLASKKLVAKSNHTKRINTNLKKSLNVGFYMFILD
ncbi:hypothetical protein BKI52_27895 [marine bacterium AO1-C]|nr:hypothetical protein BKI52_27895 [marine bacterium AO1-C]